MIEQQVWRDANFWTTELKRAGLNIPYYNKVVAGRDTPPSEMRALFRDFILGGQKVDIYFFPNGDEVYLQIKG